MPFPSRRPTARTWVAPPPPPDVELAEIEMLFTDRALSVLLATVGARLPETGAKLFGPVEGLGVDVVEFDVRGSAAAGSSVYSPDAEWGSARIRHWIDQDGDEQRVWTGDAHSHPGGFGRPSSKVGEGLGDLGFVEAVFAMNDLQAEFFIPILTGTGGRGPVEVHPWVVRRDDPLRPLWAPLAITSRRAFGPRAFAGRPGATTAVARDEVDLDLVSRLVGRPVALAADGASVEVDDGDRIVRVHLDDAGAATHVSLVDADAVTEGRLGIVGDAVPGREQRIAELAAFGAGRGREVARPPVAARPAVRRDDYRTRSSALLSPRFSTRSILVVGASGGSHLIEKLARLSPRRLVVVDPDVVEAPNLARTAFRTEHLGRPKPEAIADLVAGANPFVVVEGHARDITTLDDAEVVALVEGVDVIVAGTDSFAAQALLNVWSQRFGIPAVFIGIHAGAEGGVVQWSVPGETACYRCMSPGRYAATADELDLPGEPGLLIDVQAVDMVAASLVVALLERGEETPKGRLVAALGDRTEVVVGTTPEYAFGRSLVASLLSDLPEPVDRTADLRTYIGALPVVTLPCAPDPACPDCRAGARPSEVDVTSPPTTEEAPTVPAPSPAEGR